MSDLYALIEEYRGLLAQDGWEATALTIYTEHPEQAEKILILLKGVTL